MNILCFGDSNTWGLRPMIGDRYKKDERWTGILGTLSGGTYNIIEEGLNGRTANETDADEPYLNGRNYMEACLLSHRPVDMLIVMLGTNDVKSRYNKTAKEVADSVYFLVKDMKSLLDERQTERAKVLLIAPKSIDARVLGDSTFDECSIEKSCELADMLRCRAQKENWLFLDADDIGVTLGDDGLHLSYDGHRKLAEGIYHVIMPEPAQ